MINCPSCVFADFDSGKCKRLLIRLPHICPYSEERKPRNHFEEIKAMSIEEMAGLFEDTGDCPPRACPHDGEGANLTRKDCLACWLDWLKEEITDA